ncbi:MAG: ketoacyl-ACP synthase III [Polyangiales bacterium]
MHSISITGIGSYLPRLMHDNASLPALDDKATAEEIARIGVYRRGWAQEGESVAEMAMHAGQRALERAGLRADQLDLLILANWTQRRYIPEWAPKLQALLGATRAFAYDVGTACAGFVYGVAMAHGFLQNPRFSRALVVASETTSQRGRPHSKSTLIFGDAAGAFVLERLEPREPLEPLESRAEGAATLIDYELATDGSQHHIMDINAEGWVRTHVKQNELIALTARCFTAITEKILTRNRLTMKQIDWVVPHSGTAGVQAMLLKTLDLPREKVLTNFASIGNVSSAAIPTALDQFITDGTIKKGDLVLSPTVGTGFYSAALLYRV